jgi:hypothetical protein
MRRKERSGPGMIAVLSGGETWVTEWEDFAGDDTDREGVGRTVLPV